MKAQLKAKRKAEEREKLKAAEEAAAADEESEEEEYEVHKILQMEKRGDEWYFYVWWENYPEQDGTWEPESNLGGCPEKIAAFRKANPLNRSKSADNEDEEMTSQDAIGQTPEVANQIQDQRDAKIAGNGDLEKEKSDDESIAGNEAVITADISATSHTSVNECFETVSEPTLAANASDLSTEIGFGNWTWDQKFDFLKQLEESEKFDTVNWRQFFDITDEHFNKEHLKGLISECEAAAKDPDRRAEYDVRLIHVMMLKMEWKKRDRLAMEAL